MLGDARNLLSGGWSRRGHVVAALAAVPVLVLSALAAVAFANVGQAAQAAQKVFVCKYVGTPGQDERLKPGENPISVSSNATVGSTFNDAQGRSYVIAVDNGQEPPSCPATPPGPIPPCPTTSAPAPTTEPAPTASPPEETETTSPPPEETTPTVPERPTDTDTATPTSGEGEDCPDGDCESASPTGTAGPGDVTESPSPTTEQPAPGPGGDASVTAEQPGAGVGQCGDPDGAAGADDLGQEPGQDAGAGSGGAGDSESGPDSGAGPPAGSDAGLAAVGEVQARSEPGGFARDRPIGLTVPALGLDSRVVQVSTVGEVLQPPADPATVGWWADGRRPGTAHGRALLTAHAVHAGSGAFDELGAIDRGDRIAVRTRAARLGFTVTSVQVLDRSVVADRSASLFRQDGPPRLVLIGCTGWNGVRHTANVVVVARPR